MLYQLAAETGLRRNEIRSLTVSSLDFKKCTVIITDEASKNDKPYTLPLKHATAQALQCFVHGKTPGTRVFRKITNRTSEMIQADLADAGLSYADDAGRVFDFHALRHQCGSMLAAANVHPKIAQQIMRHGDINLTLSRYTHVFRGQEAAAIESLPDLSRPSKQRAKATGTDGRNLADSSAFLGGKPWTPSDNNGHSEAVSTVFSTGQGSIFAPMGRCSDSVSHSSTDTYKDAEMNLASCLAQIVEKHPELARLIEAWPTLSETVRRQILRLAGTHREGDQ